MMKDERIEEQISAETNPAHEPGINDEHLTPRERDLAYMPIPKIFMKLFLPAVVAMVVTSIYIFVDRLFIARLPEIGEVAIGGVGVMMPLFGIIQGIELLFGVGGAANISLALGRRDRERAQQVLGNMVSVMLICIALLCVVFIPFSRGILLWYGATETNIEYAHIYFVILLIGSLWGCVGFALNQVIRAEGNGKFSMIAMLIGSASNLILDPILMFGLNMGVAGAAYATIISQFFTFALCSIYFLKGHSGVKFDFAHMRPRFSVAKDIFAIGFTAFFRRIAGAFISVVILGKLRFYGGDMAQSAYSIMNSILNLAMMPLFAMNQALQPIIGFNYGARAYDRVKHALRHGILFASGFLAIIWIITTFFTKIPVLMMAQSPELIAMSCDALFYCCLFFPLFGIVIISSNYFTSIGAATKAFFLTISREVLLMLPMVLILPEFMELDGIWVSLGAVDVPSFFITLGFVLKDMKRISKLPDALHQQA